MAPVDDLPDVISKMPPSRRGVARKNAIIEAALELTGRDGIAGLSMRAVAAKADIPLGAVGYYFDDKTDLIHAVYERHIERETARVARAIARMGDTPSPAALADHLADFVIEGLSTMKLHVLAEYEFTVEAARRPSLAQSSSAWQTVLNGQLRSVMESLGSRSPKTDARLILAVLAGLEVDQLPTDLDPATRRSIRDVLRRLLRCLELSWHSDR
ncbi:TetR/AcrR family transcriptional regulator [Mycolicibacterium sp. PDY-3]|uniref:TetR/AcrR family transcriptional regulator n=1 Tax=Mycolicibacterium sp. PDY-3 TaxID=3376069 RepID=UPI00379BC443